MKKTEKHQHSKESEESDKSITAREFKIVFTGNIGIAQGLQILPRTALLLKDKQVRFILVGDGRYQKELLHEIHKNKLDNKFCFLGRKPAEEIPDILRSCDAAFLAFMDCPLFQMTIPAKLQSYLACGMPVLASAEGESKRIVEEAGCGLCSPAGDAAALAENICIMMETATQLRQMGENSYQYYKKHFDKVMLINQLEAFLEGD